MLDFNEFWSSLGYNRYFLIALIFLFCCHLIYVIYRTTVVMSKKSSAVHKEEKGVSIIITSNNKSEFLEKSLEAFLNQDYPEYEVIVVDECSEDNTQDILAEMQQKYPHLRTTRIFPDTKFRRTKKIAINIGVLAAKYDILLFSEINCMPVTRNWVRTMQSYFDANTAVVLGYTDYKPGKEKISIRRYFRFLRFLKMSMLVKGGMNVLGDGCNMGYRKSYYIEKRGFSKNSQLYLGFDNEMVNELSQKGSVKVIKDPEARMMIDDDRKRAWKDDYSYYYTVKRSWPFSVQLRAGWDFGVEFLLYGLSVYLLINWILPKYIFLLVFLTFLIDFIVINMYLKHLGQKKLFLTSLIVNAMGFLFKWYFSIYSIVTGKKWR